MCKNQARAKNPKLCILVLPEDASQVPSAYCKDGHPPVAPWHMRSHSDLLAWCLQVSSSTLQRWSPTGDCTCWGLSFACRRDLMLLTDLVHVAIGPSSGPILLRAQMLHCRHALSVGGSTARPSLRPSFC